MFCFVHLFVHCLFIVCSLFVHSILQSILEREGEQNQNQEDTRVAIEEMEKFKQEAVSSCSYFNPNCISEYHKYLHIRQPPS